MPGDPQVCFAAGFPYYLLPNATQYIRKKSSCDIDLNSNSNNSSTVESSLIRKNPICLFVQISYKLVPISKGQVDFDLSLNNKLKLVSISGRHTDSNLFLGL